MKRNLSSFAKLAGSVCLTALLFAVSCKEKEEDFETPCTPPAAPNAANNSPVAIGSQINLTAESIDGAVYQWTGPNGFSSSDQNPSFTFNAASQAGDYMVIITKDGCVSEAGHTYISSCLAAPKLTVTNLIQSDGTFVIGDTIDFGASFNPSATYKWVRPNASDTLVQNFRINGLKASMAGVYTLTMTLPSGTAGATCVAPSVSYTLIIKPSVPTISGTGVGVTGGTLSSPASTFIDTINGTLNMTVSSTGGSTFVWSGPNGFSSTSASISISNLTKAAEGTYYARAILAGVAGDSVGRKVVIKYANTACGADTTVTDAVTGQTYKIIQLVGRCWTKENIRRASGVDTYTWSELNANTVVDSQSVCPANWHVASDADYTLLGNAVVNDANALKDTVQDLGAGSLGTNTSGFSAKLKINLGRSFNATAGTPITSNVVKIANTAGLVVGRYIKVTSAGGGVLPDSTTISGVTNATQFTLSKNPTVAMAAGNTLAEQNLHAFFWTSTSLSSSFAWYRQLSPDNSNIVRNTQDLSVSKAYNIRCVRD